MSAVTTKSHEKTVDTFSVYMPIDFQKYLEIETHPKAWKPQKYFLDVQYEEHYIAALS